MKPVRIKQVAEVRYGLGQPPPPALDGIPILRATNIYRGRIVPEEMVFANVGDLPLHRAPLLRAGEVLVVRSGAWTGDSALVTAEWEGAAPGYDLRLTPRTIEPRFLAYQLLSSAVLDQIALAKMRAAQPHLNAEDLGDVLVVTAPRLHEAAIADYLDRELARIDRLLGLRRRQLQELDARDVTIISTALIPEGCDWTRLGRMADVQSGLTVNAGRDPGPDAVERPYLRVANVQADRLDLDSVTMIKVPRSMSERFSLRMGDVLMTEGGDLDKLARGTVWSDEFPGALHQNHVFAVRPRPLQVDSYYLALFTRTLHSRSYFERTGKQTTNLASTSSSKIRGLPVPNLSIEVQRGLVRVLREHLDWSSTMRRAVETQINLLLERRQALITAAVTGQLEIPGVAA